MREIKFRAWDTYKKLMIPEIGGFYLGSANSEMIGGDDYPVMQYTGLKDKNGVEIYEGDIVWSGGHRLQFITEYRISMGGFMFCSEVLSMGVGQNSHGIEIIGNIYENPELLKP